MIKTQIITQLENFYKLPQVEKNKKINVNITLNTLHTIINNVEKFNYLDSTILKDNNELNIFNIEIKNTNIYICIITNNFKEIIEVEEIESKNEINAKYFSREAKDFSFIITDNNDFEEGTIAMIIVPTWSSNAIIKNKIEKKEKFKYNKFSENNKFKLTEFDQNKMASYIFTGNWSQSLSWYNEIIQELSDNLDYSVDGIDFYKDISIEELYLKINKHGLFYNKELEKYANQTIPALLGTIGYSKTSKLK